MKTSSGNFVARGLWRTLAILGVLVYLTCLIFFYTSCTTPKYSFPLHFTWASKKSDPPNSPTSLDHIVFGLVGSVEAWKHRKAYIESWWRPNITRGFLYLDEVPAKDLLPWSPSSPPFRVSDDLSKLLNECKHIAPIQVRIDHAILEVFREVHEGVRWYVMGDDDSIFFVDNIVDVLAKYDHTKYIYIGGQSETVIEDWSFSFNMGFGGAGLVLSYPLAQLVAKTLEDCIKRYPYVNSADLILMTCIADLGVSFTPHKGIHQIDLHGDLSGFLSAHPQVPLLSLHHYDQIDPIFPSMNRSRAAKHLMKAGNVDQSRIMQQTICYHKPTNWSFSIAWGYSVHIYENIVSRSILQKPFETFSTWFYDVSQPASYIFNTRPWPVKDPCDAPHVFFFKSVEKTPGNDIVTTYVRKTRRDLPTCSKIGSHSADYVSKIQVFSSATKPVENGRSECCDIVPLGDTDEVEVMFRTCMKDEIIA